MRSLCPRRAPTPAAFDRLVDVAEKLEASGTRLVTEGWIDVVAVAHAPFAACSGQESSLPIASA
jgi:hypothetical protein